MAKQTKLAGAESGAASEAPVGGLVPDVAAAPVGGAVPDAAAPASPAAPEPVVETAPAPAASAPEPAPELAPAWAVIEVLSPIDDGTRHEIGEQMVVTPAAARDLVAAGAAAYAAE